MAKRQDVKMVWTHGKKGSDDAFFVRASVFMVEQGFQVEFDDTDNISWHLAVYDGDEPIGAARIFLGQGLADRTRLRVGKLPRQKAGR